MHSGVNKGNFKKALLLERRLGFNLFFMVTGVYHKSGPHVSTKNALERSWLFHGFACAQRFADKKTE